MMKRGLSPIIATVLIILITVSAATFIAGFLIPFIKNQLESTECVNYRDYFSFEDEFGLNCRETGTNTYKMSVRAKNVFNETQNNVKGFGIGFISEGNSVVVIVNEGDSPSEIKMLSDPSLDMTLPKAGEVRSYSYENGEDFENAEIYAILESGRKCEISDDVEIEICG